ncbi:ABC transporter substrate-binding protein [Desulfatiglans anilini]|uniref:ABC transporter substrate-binding protein n=1 Tax=Desulfatiglans anilini TaxID=90728 RepID=UPI0013786D66|nr:ABC transporter substrate-binding protein [Desulfatiglans anilini]
MSKKFLVSVVTFGLFYCLTVFQALAADTVKVGVISVLSGPLAVIGNGEKWSAEMAIEDYGTVLGKKIELVSRDHAYNPGVANEKAKELYEKENVDVIIACPNSAAALAVAEQARLHKKPFISTSAGTTALIGDKCNKYVIKWNYNDYMLATTVGLWGAEHLGKRWYTITSDYAWGHDLLKHFTAALKEKGGEHVGNDMVALGTSDYSPYILNAMNANPDVLVLLNVGKDAVNSTKAAMEYGLKKKCKIVHALLFEPDIRGAGPEVFADNYVAASWNWKVDNPGAREYADKYLERHGERPHFMAAAVYSATWQYLEAVKRAGTTDPDAVIKALEGHTFTDLFANPGYIRPEDHMQVAKALLLRAKKPDEIKEKEDFFEIVGTLPAEQAFGKPGQFGCQLN